MKKQGKRSKKKHLSKEAFRKIRYKQNMWRVYKHTRTDKDYDAYKEALNAATNEVRKSRRNFEHKRWPTCGEPQTMAHLLSCRLLDEACTADDLATVTERAKACARKWENIV